MYKNCSRNFSRESVFIGVRSICLYYIISNLRVRFFTFSELKIRARLKFEVLIFHSSKGSKHNISRRNSGLAKSVVNFTDS